MFSGHKLSLSHAAAAPSNADILQLLPPRKCGPGMTQRNAVRSAAGQMCLPRIHASQLHSQLYRLQDLTDFSHLKHKISKFAFESPRGFWCACCSPVHCGASWVQTSIIFFSNAITKTPRTSSLTASTREHNQLSCPPHPQFIASPTWTCCRRLWQSIW